MKVEATVPKVASTMTGTARLASVRRSTCSAPAKSRKASMPSITTEVKSMCKSAFVSGSKRCWLRIEDIDRHQDERRRDAHRQQPDVRDIGRNL